MRLTWKDGAATVLIAAIVVPYVGYLALGSVPLIHDGRAMATVALILGVAACYAGDMAVLARRWSLLTAVTAALGIAALGIAIAALVTASGLVVAAFIVIEVALWALATLRHSGHAFPSRATPPKARAAHH